MIDWQEQCPRLIYPHVKKGVKIVARAAIVALWAALVICGLCLVSSYLCYLFETRDAGDPPASYILDVIGSMATMMFNVLLCVCLGILHPWCHCVLLRHQGWVYTRVISIFGISFALLTLLALPLQLMFSFKIFPNQELAPIFSLLTLTTSLLCNWGNMAALSKVWRLSLIMAPFLLLMALLFGLLGTSIIALLLQLALLFALLKPLRWLYQHAELIVAMPELEEETN